LAGYGFFDSGGFQFCVVSLRLGFEFLMVWSFFGGVLKRVIIKDQCIYSGGGEFI